MKASNLFLVAALAALSFADAAAEPAPVVIPMHALTGSHEDGSATLTQVADGVRVVVTLAQSTSDAQPTHIHLGTCGAIKKAPEYALKSIAGGASDTVVKGVTLDDLRKGSYAINVHKSATDLETYVSCGEIR
jgi:hypothetical protein